jgi:hypothetical protein
VTGSCPECGAASPDAERSCAGRFKALLALDHSRHEPWGSRHGLAFAAYTLQHPGGATAELLDRCWLILFKVYVQGEDYRRVLGALNRRPDIGSADWGVPPPPPAPRGQYATTIADLDDFSPERYPALLDDWCRGVLAAWGASLRDGA